MLSSCVTYSWTQTPSLAGSWKQNLRFLKCGATGDWHMKADRNTLVLSFHVCLFLVSAKWICKAAQDKLVLEMLGMGANDYLGWVLAGNGCWCGRNLLGPPFLSAHLDMKEQTGIYQWFTPSPVEMSSILYIWGCIMELVTCSLNLYFVLFFTFETVQMCCTV